MSELEKDSASKVTLIPVSTVIVAVIGILTTIIAGTVNLNRTAAQVMPTATVIPVTLTPTIPAVMEANPLPRIVVANQFFNAPVAMVLIPPGEFMMGSDNGSFDEQPAHRVYVDAFYIDQYEVTNALYAECVYEGVCRPPMDVGETKIDSQYYGKPEYDEYPVNNVNWHMANTYCIWRGGRLPTEAEWEKAARGTDGRNYPWQDDEISCDYANYGECGEILMPVGNYEAGKSFYDVYDMAGNVWEWVNSLYHYYPYVEGFSEQVTEYKNRVVRGGGWDDLDTSLRTTNRTWMHPWLAYSYTTIGFRCAMDVTP